MAPRRSFVLKCYRLIQFKMFPKTKHIQYKVRIKGHEAFTVAFKYSAKKTNFHKSTKIIILCVAVLLTLGFFYLFFGKGKSINLPYLSRAIVGEGGQVCG